MTSFRLRAVLCAMLLCWALSLLHAQSSSVTSTANPSADSPARINQVVNDNVLTRLKSSRHPLATAANDRGRVDGSLALNRVLLMLKPSDQQQAALRKLL